jgi:hypothetical protein
MKVAGERNKRRERYVEVTREMHSRYRRDM